MALETGPIGKAVAPGNDELGRAQREQTQERGVEQRFGVVSGNLCHRLGTARPHSSLKLFGLVAELLEIGLVGERDSRHDNSFRRPAVRVARQKGGITAS